jgi:hypothetical protein
MFATIYGYLAAEQPRLAAEFAYFGARDDFGRVLQSRVVAVQPDSFRPSAQILGRWASALRADSSVEEVITLK